MENQNQIGSPRTQETPQFENTKSVPTDNNIIETGDPETRYTIKQCKTCKGHGDAWYSQTRHLCPNVHTDELTCPLCDNKGHVWI